MAKTIRSTAALDRSTYWVQLPHHKGGYKAYYVSAGIHEEDEGEFKYYSVNCEKAEKQRAARAARALCKACGVEFNSLNSSEDHRKAHKGISRNAARRRAREKHAGKRTARYRHAASHLSDCFE